MQCNIKGEAISVGRFYGITAMYRMRLNFRGTKLSRMADLHNIRGFYFRG